MALGLVTPLARAARAALTVLRGASRGSAAVLVTRGGQPPVWPTDSLGVHDLPWPHPRPADRRNLVDATS